jgi:hypothetical protein
MALAALRLKDPMKPEAVQTRLLNHDDRMERPGPRQRFAPQLRQPGNAETSPALISRFDSFSPAPGDSEVTSHVERLSSNETKIAPSCERIAAVSVKERSSDIGRLQSGG